MGQVVWLPEYNFTTNVGEEVAPRSYSVTTSQGQVRRNRGDLIQLPHTATTPDPPVNTTPELPVREYR